LRGVDAGMLYLAIIMVFLTFYTIFYLIFSNTNKSSHVIAARLDKISKEDFKNANSELNQPLFVRVIHPLLDETSKTILKITPKEIIKGLEKKIIMAGHPFNATLKDWISIQVIVIVCFPMITFILGFLNIIQMGIAIFLFLIEVCLGLVLPHLVLNKKVSDRQKEMMNSLPDTLDLLTVSVEAGLGFDGALAKVVDKMKGAISEEFENVLQEMKVGKQKKDSLKDMAERVNLQDLSTFIGSIIQADQLGVSIGNVLRIQSEQIRQKRRQRAQEKAMKAPIKMLIPMVLFIFPTIFSVLLGPVVIKAIDMFSK